METPESPREPTPAEREAEQLMRALDLQLQRSRAARASTGSGRTAFRVLAIVVLLGGTLVALWVLEQITASLRPARNAPTPPAPSEQVSD